MIIKAGDLYQSKKNPHLFVMVVSIKEISRRPEESHFELKYLLNEKVHSVVNFIGDMQRVWD